MGEQLGCILEFVDHQRGPKALQKQGRFLFGKASNRRVIQGNIGSVIVPNVLDECRFSDLPRSDNQQNRKLPVGFLEKIFQGSRTVCAHLQYIVQNASKLHFRR
jgi:hypothetical protein